MLEKKKQKYYCTLAILRHDKLRETGYAIQYL